MGQFIGGSGPFGYARPADSDESFESMSFQERPPGYLAEIRDSRPDLATRLERMFDTQTQLDELSHFVTTGEHFEVFCGRNYWPGIRVLSAYLGG